jgi:membrane associated rhomboid family serine protease
MGDGAYKMLAMYFPENAGFQYGNLYSHMFMHGGYMHIFSIYCLCISLDLRWRAFGVVKKFLFYISGAALLHTGINYYYFSE